jgi:sigma-B regulation protein RsbU (phosphoserine phosphatase)
VAQPGTKHLRLYTGQPHATGSPTAGGIGSLSGLLKAFRTATGWSLRYVAGPEPDEPNDLTWSAPVNPGVGVTLGHLRLDPVQPDPGVTGKWPLDREVTQAMASAFGGMLGELMETRRLLWHREAELAAGVPLVPHGEQEGHLAARLQAVVKAGAEAVDCQAAALYLLDEATTELKLRCGWGLPYDWLTQPARPLKGSTADLEALLGHAVVLRDPDVMRYWRVPEVFPAAVCIPVSTPTTLLGTLWIYSAAARDFTDRQTNMLEVVAGRLAIELEREMLLGEAVAMVEMKRQVAATERLQRSQLPTISPLLEGWELAGWTAQSGAIGGDFYDWFCLPNGLLAAAVGDAAGKGLPAAMAAAAVKAAVRAHGQYHRDAEQTLRRANLTLWTGSAGDQSTTLFYGLIETATGRVCYASAGQPGAVVVRADGWEPLSHPSPPLGESPEADYGQFAYELRPGETLIVFTPGLRDALDRQGRPLGEAGIAEPLVGRAHLSADQLTRLVGDHLNAHAADPGRDDCTVLAIRRTEG